MPASAAPGCSCRTSLPPSSGRPSSGTSICRQCSVVLSSCCANVRGLFCRNVLIPFLSLQKESRKKGTAAGAFRKLQSSCQGWVCQERHCWGCGMCMFILLDLFLRRAQRQPRTGARGPASREGRVAMSYGRTSQILPCSLSHTPKPGGALRKELRRRTTQISLVLEERLWEITRGEGGSGGSGMSPKGVPTPERPHTPCLAQPLRLELEAQGWGGPGCGAGTHFQRLFCRVGVSRTE